MAEVGARMPPQQLTVLGPEGNALGFIFSPVETTLNELRKQMQKELKAPLIASLPRGWLFELNGVVVSKVQEKIFTAADVSGEHRRLSLAEDVTASRPPAVKAPAAEKAASNDENENKGLENVEQEAAKATKKAERVEKDPAKAAAKAEAAAAKELAKAAKEAERAEKEQAKAAAKAEREAAAEEKERAKAAKEAAAAEKERAKAAAQAEREAAAAEKDRVKAAKEAERAAALAEKEAAKQAREAEKTAKQAEASKKAEAKAAKAAEPKAPKKPSNQYACYVAATQAALKEEQPSLTQPEVMKVLGERWKGMGEAERAPFLRDADKDEARYRAEYADYAATCAATGLAPVKEAPLPKAAQPKQAPVATAATARTTVTELDSPAPASLPAICAHLSNLSASNVRIICCGLHPCELVPIEQLFIGGTPRAQTATCDSCGVRDCMWTCKPCDFDVCNRCVATKQNVFGIVELEAPPAPGTPTWLRTAANEVGISTPHLDAFGNRVPRTSKAAHKQPAKSETKKLQQQKREAASVQMPFGLEGWLGGGATEEREERYRAEDAAREAKHAATIGTETFTAKIKRPPASNLKPSGKGFSVWSSCGYGNDGWHSYNPPPDKVFDSSFTNVADANARAKYLFYVKNPWGVDPVEDLLERNEIDESLTGPKRNLVRLQVHPDDGEVWTVGIVPDSAFAHLDNARMPDKWEVEARDESEPGMGVIGVF